MQDGKNFSNYSMRELFLLEAEQQVAALTDNLLQLESAPSDMTKLESLMRAAHSIKGAARVVQVQPIVDLAHVMEDVFVGAMQNTLVLGSGAVDILLQGADTILRLARLEENIDIWLTRHPSEMHELLAALTALSANNALISQDARDKVSVTFGVSKADALDREMGASAALSNTIAAMGLRQLDRLMALAGESMVEARWIGTHIQNMHRLKRLQTELLSNIDKLRESLHGIKLPEISQILLGDVQSKANFCRALLTEKVSELDVYDRRTASRAERLHREVMISRMRPFGDCLVHLPRLARDVARLLGKSVALATSGHQTLLDRDIVANLDTLLKHLINNAIDHGIETPLERNQAGKSDAGSITLSAFQRKGAVFIAIEDDGRGVDLQRLRKKIIEKKLATEVLASSLSDQELMDFLFLPGFSTREVVTEISGRGVGLDVVRDMVHALHGTVKAESHPGKGMRILLQFPLTLSVMPALLVEIAGEPYGISLARIDRVLREERDNTLHLEGQLCLQQGTHTLPLLPMSALLGLPDLSDKQGGFILAVVLNDGERAYGLIVDRLLGERDLVVQALPVQLGRIQDISSGALMEDGSPVLMIDVDDILLACKKAMEFGLPQEHAKTFNNTRKRILIVDDSLTVREVQRKILEAEGYQVETAVDGMDAWNILRAETFDLMISDVDMPRINGIELVRMLKNDDGLRELPVMIVSYKDRDEDRFRGLEAGADYYLGKGNAHEDAFRVAVYNLIGMASA